MSKDKITRRINMSTSSETGRSNSMPPKGAIIIDKNTEVRSEEIENGFILTKSTHGSYKVKSDDESKWFDVTQKWYSKTDPLEVNLENKSLAEIFEDE